MPRKKSDEQKEHPPAPRRLNPVWELALVITDEMHPHELSRSQVQMMNVKHLNQLKSYYDLQDVVDCWRNLRSDESVAGFRIDDAKLTTVVKGAPCYIDRWIEAQLELPPVYETWAHDTAVQERAIFLRRHGFHYGATDYPGRLTSEQVAELGL